MKDLTVRPVRAGDLPQVLPMVEALAAHHGDQALLDVETLRRDVLGAVPWVTVLVAEVPAGLVGYAALVPLARLQFGERGMDMQNLFVVPERRGQGVGKALIAQSCAHAKALSCAYIAVGTHPNNAAAQAVYEAQGFERLAPPGPRFGKWL